MDFQKIKRVENPDFYLDVAFKRAKNKADLARSESKKMKTRLSKSKNIELQKLSVIKDTLQSHFEKIVKSFPSLDDMSEFYKEMIKNTLDYATLKKSLGAVNSAKLVTGDIFRVYDRKIKRCQDLKKINDYRREYYGRISSIPKRIKKELSYLENARKTMRKYPNIKEGMPTICIAGFPNVGKSTLLAKLTTAKPEINKYPFTTKGVNVGYMEQKYDKVQFVDTPGTLNRFDKMNYIEKIAYLAMKYVADKIVYVFDLTEEYPLKDQEKLLKRVKGLDKEVVIYLSKTDILNKKIVDEFTKKHEDVIIDFKEIKEMDFI